MNNNKVCIELIVPIIDERYNVFIPISKKTIEIIYLLAKAINEMTDGAFQITNTLSLRNAETGKNYEVENTIYGNGILNGTRVVLL